MQVQPQQWQWQWAVAGATQSRGNDSRGWLSSNSFASAAGNRVALRCAGLHCAALHCAARPREPRSSARASIKDGEGNSTRGSGHGFARVLLAAFVVAAAALLTHAEADAARYLDDGDNVITAKSDAQLVSVGNVTGGSFPTASIVGGSSVTGTPYPWVVSLQVKVGKYYEHACAGFLIHKKWLLTSAHCIEDNEIKRVILGVSSLALSKGRIKRKVKKEIMHADFARNPVENDIALIKLNKAVHKKKVKPVQLCTEDMASTLEVSGELATIAGWGATFENGWTKDVLRTAEVPLVNRSTCTAKGAMSAKAIFETSICAGYEDGGVDTCVGDSGGPLFVQDDEDTNVVVGITSWGVGCARPGKYGVYTRVSSYISWIEEQARISISSS
ncbi:Serine protease 56 [Hondaea fermentalgiana]|uniref:Serine protease 56 n=1 Tax=Hondaea fermentalgiana TaxID=2315210 RepID=A0A2R5G9X6_9STRA|nr:Serine protease 56 [Hondaea fermentalgiana]|eukprot:GBG27375.1 Serine protease 56 [Hondaea fermentalgiana]